MERRLDRRRAGEFLASSRRPVGSADFFESRGIRVAQWADAPQLAARAAPARLILDVGQLGRPIVRLAVICTSAAPSADDGRRRAPPGRSRRSEAFEELPDAQVQIELRPEWFNASMVSGPGGRVADGAGRVRPNFSEGTRPRVMDAIQAAAGRAAPVLGRVPTCTTAWCSRSDHPSPSPQRFVQRPRRNADRPERAPRLRVSGPPTSSRLCRSAQPACRCASSSPYAGSRLSRSARVPLW